MIRALALFLIFTRFAPERLDIRLLFYFFSDSSIFKYFNKNIRISVKWNRLFRQKGGLSQIFMSTFTFECFSWLLRGGHPWGGGQDGGGGQQVWPRVDGQGHVPPQAGHQPVDRGHHGGGGISVRGRGLPITVLSSSQCVNHKLVNPEISRGLTSILSPGTPLDFTIPWDG